jgi:predicted ATPase
LSFHDKFDQYKRDIPYATLAQAFQSLVRPLLGKSEAELGRWRNALREPLMRTLEAIRKAGAQVHEIALAPLGLDDVGYLVSDALHSKPERAQPLAQLVQEKTGGNPFFAIQFFTVLAEEGLLAFDPDAADWTWDVARIQAKRYTDNVVELMAGKLNRLPSSTQEALHLRRRSTRHSLTPYVLSSFSA